MDLAGTVPVGDWDRRYYDLLQGMADVNTMEPFAVFLTLAAMEGDVMIVNFVPLGW